MTIAQQVSEQFGDDGRKLVVDGVHIADACAKAGGTCVAQGGTHRYTFADGSVITYQQNPEAWDLGFRGCWCFAGKGAEHNEGCAAL